MVRTRDFISQWSASIFCYGINEHQLAINRWNKIYENHDPTIKVITLRRIDAEMKCHNSVLRRGGILIRPIRS